MIAAMRTAVVWLLACGAVLSAQGARTFKARLAPVPIDLAMQATVAGSGSVTASLAGTRLTMNGVFEGLKSPATIAKVHKSPARGVRGPDIFELKVSTAQSGTISGTLDLTAQQVTDLQRGLLYVQVHSEKAPDGNLWGWLMPEKKP